MQQQLHSFTPIDTSNARGLVFSAVQQRLSKVNLIFDQNWGQFDNQTYNGGSFTDLPIGSLYMAPAWRSKNGTGTFYAAAIYCDYYNANFWNSMYDEQDPYPISKSVNGMKQNFIIHYMQVNTW